MTPRERAIFRGALAASIAWQLYVIVFAFRYAPRFDALFNSLGAEVPVLTRALMLTYRGWVVVPVVVAILGVRASRNENSSPAHLGLLVAFSIAAGFAMQTWLYEAYFAPMLALTQQIG